MDIKTLIDSDSFSSAAQTRKFPGIAVVGLSDVEIDDDGKLSRESVVLHFVSLATAHGVVRATREYMVDDAKTLSPEKFISHYGEIISTVLADLATHYPQVPSENFILCLTPVGSKRSYTLSDYPEFQSGGKFEEAFKGSPDESYAKAVKESRGANARSAYADHKGGDSKPARSASFAPSRC